MSFSSNGGTIQPHEQIKYEKIFNSLDPVGGKLPGEKVRPVLLKSNLPIEVLGRVWDLSDIDKDGFLDKEEFNIAMHLVYRAIDKEPVPSVLPLSLVPPSKQMMKSASPILQQQSAPSLSKPILPGSVCVMPPTSVPASSIISKPPQEIPTSTTTSVAPQSTNTPKPLYISPADRARYSGLFQNQKDQFGFISGESAKLIFLQSGLSQTILADIWSMCDPLQQGRLKHDQFLLAMHLISQTCKGIEIPKLVSPDYLLTSHDSGFGDDGGSISDGSSSVGDTAAIRELDALNKEIEELRKEKEVLGGEIQTKEQTIKLTSNVVQELQEKLDKDNNTLAQLERDKTDTQTRLEELEQNRKKLDVMLSDIKTKMEEEKENIKKLNNQLLMQQATADQQEKELNQLNKELGELKKEQTQLEQRLQAEKQQENTMSLKITQAKQEQEKVKQEIEKCKQQTSTAAMNISEMDKEITLNLKEQPAKLANDDTSMLPSQSVFSMGGMQEKIEDLKSDLNENIFKPDPDPFKSGDPFSGADPFAESKLFGTTDKSIDVDDKNNVTSSEITFPSSFPPTTASKVDPFASTNDATDPFSSNDITSTTTAVENPFNDGDPAAVVVDPFMATSVSADPFASSDADPFTGADPFESDKSSATTIAVTTSQPQSNTPVPLDNQSSVVSSDPFAGSDPFTSSNVFDTKFPSEPAATASSGGFASSNCTIDPFNDKQQDVNDDFFAFNDFKKQTATTTTADDDPWGATSTSSANTTNITSSADPFGSNAFGSSNVFGSDNSFGKSQPWGGAVEKQPLPSQPSLSKTLPTETQNKDKQKRPMTESEQLAWAQQESKREEERRKKMQQQEQADLELAIKLSKQQS